MKKFPSWLFATSLGKETHWDIGWSIFPSCWILFCRHVKGTAHKNKIQLFQDLLQMNERKAEDLQFQLHSNLSYFSHWISLLKPTKKFISSTPLSSLFSQASVPTQNSPKFFPLRKQTLPQSTNKHHQFQCEECGNTIHVHNITLLLMLQLCPRTRQMQSKLEVMGKVLVKVWDEGLTCNSCR